jgi:plastocyanin
MHRLSGRAPQRLTLAFTSTALLAVMIVAGAAGASPAQAQGTTAVSIVDFAFQPASVTVPVGATVTWTNNGMAPHTSTSSAGGWDSGSLTSGQSFSFTFPRAGSFSYICTIHPSMMGTVVVQVGAAAPPAAAPAAAQPTPRPAAAAPAAQRPAAAPAAAAPQAQRPAAAPAAPRAAAPGQGGAAPAARPAAQAAALPRSGVGGALAADSDAIVPALAAGAALFAGLTTLAYRRRRSS